MLRLRLPLRLVTLSFACLAACGGSSSSDISESDPIVGIWSKVDERSGPERESRKELHLVLNADGTHEWLGKYVDVVGTTAKTTTTTHAPCGKGTYAFANGTLSLTTEMVAYEYNSGTGKTTSLTETKRDSYQVELLDGAIRLDGADVFKRATRPEGEYCPDLAQ